MDQKDLLYRASLQAVRRSHIGKEVDRLEEDSASLRRYHWWSNARPSSVHTPDPIPSLQ